MTKTELFIKLAQPDANGVSRWVSAREFVGEYADLKFGNGASWARKESTLAKRYIIEFDKSITPGNGIDRIRLNGFNDGGYLVLDPFMGSGTTAVACVETDRKFIGFEINKTYWEASRERLASVYKEN